MVTTSIPSIDSMSRLHPDHVGRALQAIGEATVVLTAEFAGEGPRIAFADSTFQHLTGYAWQKSDDTSLNQLLAHPLSANDLTALEESLSRGDDWNGSVVLRGASGSEVKMTLRAQPFSVVKGSKMPFVAELRDESLQKTIGTTLEDMRSRLDMVQSVLAAGSWVTELGEQPRMQISPELMTMFELTERELAFDPGAFFSRIHPADRERLSQMARTGLVEQKGFDVQHRIMLPSGKVRWVHARGTPVTASGLGPARLIGVVFDITERVRAEESLSQVERRYRAATEAVQDALLILAAHHGPEGPDFVVVDINQQAAELLGVTRQQSLGRCIHDLAPSLYAVGFVSKCLTVLERGVPHQETTPRSVLEFGPKWLRWRIVPSGEGIAVSAADVSWEQELSLQLAETSRLESVGSLAVSIAHDFNNMLSAIMGFSELARDASPPHSQARADIDQAVRAAERATQLTRYLLAFGSRQPLEPQLVDVGALLRDLSPILERLAGSSITITKTFALGSTAWLDPSLLDQAIINLVVNAKDAMLAGGTLRIVVGLDEVERTHRACAQGCPSGELVHLSVSDNGIGMDTETQAHIFEPFFTTKAEKGGTGLGLASVYGFVKQSGGAILVDSTLGDGTTFHIYFPVARAMRRSSAPPVPDVSPSRVRRAATILLVEPDESVRSIARRVLQLNGYQVLEAADAAAAQIQFSASEYAVDLLLTAMRLPHLGGVELARRLRRHQSRLQILLMSGVAEMREIEDATHDLGALFLPKPITASSLMAHVQQSLCQHASNALDGSHEH